MTGVQQGRWRYAKWLLVAAAGLACLWLVQAWLRPQHALAARVAARLETASPEALSQHMRQLAAFGDAGLPHLVQALKHERRDIADEARTVLSEELDRWQLLEQRVASRRLAFLARELAQGIEGCSPPTRRLASDLATRILLWPVDVTAIDQQQLIADCERVLVSVRGREEPTVLATQVASANLSPRGGGDKVLPLDEELHLPGGGLPVEMTPAPALPPAERAQPRALAPADDADLLPVIEPGEEPRRFRPEAGANLPADTQRGGDATIERIYQLVSNDVDARDAAEAQLRASGFSEALLAVARQFADPRASVRRALVTQLSRQSVVDARPWLLRLLADEDAGVRLAAAHVLATTSDPQLLRELRERAIEENDPEVRRVLEKATTER